MEEERFSCFNPMNKACNYCQQSHVQDMYMYPFPGLPFGFENIRDENDFEKDDHVNLDFDEDFNRAHYTTDEILSRIERTNPNILRSITMAGIPYRSARNIAGQIIYLTLSNLEKIPK